MSLDASLIKKIRLARKIVAIGVVGGFELDIVLEKMPSPGRVTYANGKRRIWSNLSKLSAELAALGIRSFDVHPVGYEPGIVRQPRPDRALALRAATNRNTLV